MKCYRIFVNHFNALYILIIRCILGFICRIHNCFKCKFYILCCKRLTIMPLDSFLKMKRVC